MAGLDIRSVRDVMKAVEPLAKSLGASCRIEPGNGHARLIIGFNGKFRSTPVSTSPSNIGNAVKQKCADVRRIVRELTP